MLTKICCKNIFTIFSQQIIHDKLLLVLVSNNLPLKIYCENIILSFLSFNFLFFILSFSLSLFLSSTRLFILFFPLFFSSTHVFFTFSLSSLLTFLYAFHLHQTTICLLSFSLSLLSSTHSATQPTPTHFFTLIFTGNFS